METHNYDQYDSPTRITNGQPGRNRILRYDSSDRLNAAADSQNRTPAATATTPWADASKKPPLMPMATPDTTVYYLCSDEGLFGEYDPTGTHCHHPQSEYQTTPLWKKTHYGYAYYHRDHLGTPIVLTDKSNAVVWEARYKVFGERNVVTSAIANNLGFPGQCFDGETGLWQNWFKDYDHMTGRYIENDPIGLGMNVYVYVLVNPLRFVDPRGKNIMDCLHLSGDDLAECIFDRAFS